MGASIYLCMFLFRTVCRGIHKCVQWVFVCVLVHICQHTYGSICLYAQMYMCIHSCVAFWTRSQQLYRKSVGIVLHVWCYVSLIVWVDVPLFLDQLECIWNNGLIIAFQYLSKLYIEAVKFLYFEGINFRGIKFREFFAKFAKVCPAKNVKGHIRESFSREILYKLAFAKIYPANLCLIFSLVKVFPWAMASSFIPPQTRLYVQGGGGVFHMIALQNILYNRCSIPSFKYNPQFIPSIAQWYIQLRRLV